MSPEHIWQLTTSLAVTSGAVSIFATWRLGRAHTAAAEKEARAAQEQSAKARDDAERLRAALNAAGQRLLASEQNERDLATQRAQLERTISLLQGELSSRDAELKRLTQEKDAVSVELQAAQREVKAAKKQLATLTALHDTQKSRVGRAENELEAMRRITQTLALPNNGDLYEPLAAERRSTTRSIVRELWADQNAVAAAIVDRRGYAQIGYGRENGIEGLAVMTALLAEAEKPLARVLNAPLRFFSLRTSTEGRHFMELADTGLWLGIEGRPLPPMLALQLSALRLAGAAVSFGQHPLRTPVRTPEVTNPRARELHSVLGEWGQRWNTDGVALLGADGSVVATSNIEVAPGLGRVREALQPLYLRLVRDRVPLSEVELTAQSAQRSSFTLRLLGDRALALGIAVAAPQPLPPEALDELADTLNWLAMNEGQDSPETAAA